MGKRFDALRVAFARPKRTDWKQLYAEIAKEHVDLLEQQEALPYDSLFKAHGRQADTIVSLRKQNENQMDSLTRLGKDNRVLSARIAAFESAVEMREDADKIADPFRPKVERDSQGRSHTMHPFKALVKAGSVSMECETCGRFASSNMHPSVNGTHPFRSGFEGNAWKCKTCGAGTRDLRHKGHTPIPVPTKEASEEAIAVVESLPGWDVSIRYTRTPGERGTDGYYVSGRALNLSPKNKSKRRAFVHVFTCPKISSRREDDTIRVQGDPDYGQEANRNTIGGWLWGADMRQVRKLAKSHHKYTKLCECIPGNVIDDADNSNGQIGSMITAEQEEE
jgi:hypothetical protein